MFGKLKNLPGALQSAASLFRDELSDRAGPSGYVTAFLIHAEGPDRGKVYRSYEGKNVVTDFLNTPALSSKLSGRDLIRRNIVASSVTGSLRGDADACVGQMILGTGTTAEVSTDAVLANPAISPSPLRSLDSTNGVTFDTSNPYVTFTVTYPTDEANIKISEVALLSNRNWSSASSPAYTDYDFLARKTFTPFEKTSAFTLAVKWTLRF